MGWLKQSELPPLVQLQDVIGQWFDTELGQQLLADEQRVLDTLMPKLYGYHLLQVGVRHNTDLTSGSPAGHRFLLVPRVELGTPETAVVGAMESLPIASECVDAVVLQHSLDFAQSPHQALREAVRVLRPGGKLIIVGFNPYSLWGLYRLLQTGLGRKRPSKAPWLAHFMSHRRIHDWLRLLEMKPERVEFGGGAMPSCSSRWAQRLKIGGGEGSHVLHAVIGAFWVVSASKETYAATPVGRSWHRRLALPLPTVQAQNPADAYSKPLIAADAEDEK